jgi:hypothetical protein
MTQGRDEGRPLGRAVSLDDIEEGVLAQSEPVADFALGLAFADEL